MKEQRFALTTFDNPFDPIDEFDEWFKFDKENNYNSCELLDRFVMIEDDFTDQEYNREVERAIDEIIQFDLRDVYRKVTKNVGTA